MGALAHINRKEYLNIFIALVILTALEVGVVYVPGIGSGLLISALILMALAKAGLVALFFMHLKSETRALKLTVLIPMMLPAIYALVLITEASWRYLRW